jgi:hypothetical protein
VQTTQLPATQTSPPGQELASGRFPVSVQTAVPVPQVNCAVWHGFVEAHATPPLHATHAAFRSQMSPVPQLVPAAALTPVSVQVDTPVLQSVVPR